MNALEIRELRKTYKGGVNALKGVSLNVKEGDFFALLGPNGAGKSTLIGIITSLVNRSSGEIKVFGDNLFSNPSAAKSHIGLVPQEINFSLFEKVMQIVVNQAGYYGIDRITATKRAEVILKELRLWDKRNETSRKLSGGMKRRLLIARALVHQPKLLILDEPTAGVDIEIRRSTWEYLKKINASGTTIILTTHYLEEAENLCRNIAIIDHGEIIENSSMKALLEKISSETIIADLEKPLKQIPYSSDYLISSIDEHSLEIKVRDSQGINDLFSWFNHHEIAVRSIRNKSNRLEELFMGMIEGKNEQ
ncbi:MAG: ABC transporter ATP-binding protein [Gammaproteobacteria bacterium]|nr:MAG: ABC transporter ATP-binding protein [Gammaproteobacteria bacterium]